MDEAQTPAPIAEPQPSSLPESKSKIQIRSILIILAVVLLVATVVGGIFLLASAPEGTTAKVRDIFIIVMALESLILGVGLIVLILQLATLINLLQNEIKPILDSTTETVNNLRGTTQFLSNNLVEPVLKLNEYLAGMKKFWDVFRPGKH
ncbi:MAG: hypothetical protein ACYC3H_04480 [Bellilinea sp.]